METASGTERNDPVDPTEPVALYDTTLRDGAQSEDVQFSVEDKLRITRRLDELGVDFIEGGWPGANPKDEAFFREASRLTWHHARLTAFGSTRRAGVPAERDVVLKGLLDSGARVATIFGKTWDLHVTRALGISLEENLDLIHDSIRYLKARMDLVFFDAEHYFDGCKSNPDYALAVLTAAHQAGADCLVLCDTNGGCLVDEVTALTRRAKAVGGALGIHCHNDSGLAVANTLAAVAAGAMQVQGTVNGLGERCGNANLMTIIPNLMLKMGRRTALSSDQLAQLSSVSRFVSELANLSPQKNQPFVGDSAFAHKGGIHVSAVLKDSITYEHIRPEQVGNRQRVLLSEQSGKSNLLFKLTEMGLDEVDPDDPRIRELLQELKELELRGYQFDAADASFELRLRRALKQLPSYFTLRGFRVIDERRKGADGGKLLISDASVQVEVGGEMEHTAAEGNGPVNALDKALRKALKRFYPQLEEMTLSDFKVRILNTGGTGAMVRVLIESQDGKDRWGTVGVSANILAASYEALVDAVIYKLLKEGVTPPG
ncbi:MAG: citramalate synthase [Magnetococcales bacterium]|nr:citramalate synthase [Magnetococcales bacterium]